MLSGDTQLILLLTPTGSFKLAELAATKLIGPLEDRQMDGLVSCQPFASNTLEYAINGCETEHSGKVLAGLLSYIHMTVDSDCLEILT